MKGAPNPDVYAVKREVLAEVEALSEQGQIDLLYGDESRVSLLPCVPYGWQFADEQVVMPSEKGGGVNCFALISRKNQCHAYLTGQSHCGLDQRATGCAFTVCVPPDGGGSGQCFGASKSR